MAEDLPIYTANMGLRTGLQFSDLASLSQVDLSPIWEKSDHFIGMLEGATDWESAGCLDGAG